MSKLSKLFRPDKEFSFLEKMPGSLSSSGDTLNQGMVWSHTRHFDPGQTAIQGIETYKQTGDLFHTLIDPSGDDPLGIWPHEGNKEYQALKRAEFEASLPEMKEKIAKSRAKKRKKKGFGMAAGGSTSAPRKKTKKPSKCGVGGYYRKR